MNKEHVWICPNCGCVHSMEERKNSDGLCIGCGESCFLTEYVLGSYAYIEDAIRTESANMFPVNRRIAHGVIGISTEAGEMLGNLKKAMFYGNTLDVLNIKEDIGDIFWYIAILCDELEVSMESLMEQNINKLRIRYPEKFSQQASDRRNYVAEAQAFKEPENDERAS